MRAMADAVAKVEPVRTVTAGALYAFGGAILVIFVFGLTAAAIDRIGREGRDLELERCYRRLESSGLDRPFEFERRELSE